ncbi:uncharacterized protein LOC119680214 [Teleopsis dalmanni]|uniref:uncharacterized protein LOC119673228 n=1 Tax=Teleopsis dalmanni TaxID=139649 RepID=UPI0018CFE673|nr:uncharacterized protein LOC119673228 [Teleopsis dalmanni]XP_037948847.1 uncharacterized protein LOC119680214 [Teleopsis dalmanni]
MCTSIASKWQNKYRKKQRLFIIAFALVAVTSAASISNEYLAPVADNNLPNQEYLPPTEEEQSKLADDGYRYKVVRKLRLRHRRDVSELPANDYLPPTEEAQDAPVAVETPVEDTVKAEDGYRYKVVRRLKYRHRRDVNELPANDYLPPTEEAQDAPLVEEAPVEDTVKGVDGYRYKVVRRLKYRHRRDVNELPANDYLPPTEGAQDAPIAIEAPVEDTFKADDGYRYKVVRRLRYRHRRDVNELPANDYLPPTEESQDVPVVDEAPVEDTVKAADGYRYKVVRRLKYRHRRDVNELPANDYLPPTEEAQEAPVAVEAPVEDTIKADDGYRYKVVRRLKYRHRRDVNELPANDYLPPTEESQDAPVVDEAPVEDTVKAADGYRYKVVRRLKYRHRRDVNELPANDYLPPTEESQDAPVVDEAPVEDTVKAADGYRYKVVRRLKYRHRRDVNELPANDYLPPTIEAQDQEVAVQNPEETAVLAKDGYRYKTLRRLKYRRH